MALKFREACSTYTPLRLRTCLKLTSLGAPTPTSSADIPNPPSHPPPPLLLGNGFCVFTSFKCYTQHWRVLGCSSGGAFVRHTGALQFNSSDGAALSPNQAHCLEATLYSIFASKNYKEAASRPLTLLLHEHCAALVRLNNEVLPYTEREVIENDKQSDVPECIFTSLAQRRHEALVEDLSRNNAFVKGKYPERQ